MNNARIAWIIAALLAVILVFVLVMRMSPGSGVAQIRAVIEKDCLATDEASRTRCSQDLQELSDTLSRFSQNLGETAAPASE